VRVERPGIPGRFFSSAKTATTTGDDATAVPRAANTTRACDRPGEPYRGSDPHRSPLARNRWRGPQAFDRGNRRRDAGVSVRRPGRATAKHPDSEKPRAESLSGIGGEDAAGFTLEFKRPRLTPIAADPDARRRVAKRRPTTRDNGRATIAMPFMYQNPHPALMKCAIHSTKNTP
jgi:hypothetical protein